MGNNIQRINGMSFDFALGGTDIHADKFSIDITDNTAVAKKDGRPDGWVQGDVEASGEMTLDRTEFKLIVEAAKKAGSFQMMETFDINAFAQAGDDEFKVEAFGCKIIMSKLLDVDKTSTDKSQFTVPFKITSPDFINIDGVPYLESKSAGA